MSAKIKMALPAAIIAGLMVSGCATVDTKEPRIATSSARSTASESLADLERTNAAAAQRVKESRNAFAAKVRGIQSSGDAAKDKVVSNAHNTLMELKKQVEEGVSDAMPKPISDEDIMGGKPSS